MIQENYVEELKSTNYMIYLLFLRLRRNTGEFLEIMSNNDIYITGSIILQYIFETTYTKSDVDLLCRCHIDKNNSECSMMTFLSDLSLTDVYRYNASNRTKNGFSNCEYQDLTYIHSVYTYRDINIQIIHIDTDYLTFIQGFHSTCVMNLWNPRMGTFMLYPELTMKKINVLKDNFVLYYVNDYMKNNKRTIDTLNISSTIYSDYSAVYLLYILDNVLFSYKDVINKLMISNILENIKSIKDKTKAKIDINKNIEIEESIKSLYQINFYSYEKLKRIKYILQKYSDRGFINTF
ncbi:hypothetical protein HDU92_008447 [Lobulomyces angularis]|nr:hypothetical protein HDU92_008447 [Lobulomyces angularis]